ncbi:MAG TPA: methyltransferase domain-containing protein [Ktedonosporobacter sp.]|nr:methyltransferase domain-containing protein [Ktedonosporobacter sp.]
MTAPDSQNESKNTYLIDAESAAEMARLLDQERLMTESMGGIFPELTDLSEIFDVLDVACGPGGWVHEVAHTYPKMEVVGIDISQRMISYARAHAQVRKLPNATFHVMDALQPLDFPDNSFDLVNARIIFGFMLPKIWPQFLADCKRMVRPGGIIRLVEVETGPTNQPAIETYYSLIYTSMAQAKRSFSPTGRYLGMHAIMKPMLREAGFQDIQYKAMILDYSFGTPAYEATRQDIISVLKLIQPFLIQTKIVSQEEIEKLYEQAIEEVNSEEFCGITYLLTVWGRKPAEET